MAETHTTQEYDLCTSLQTVLLALKDADGNTIFPIVEIRREIPQLVQSFPAVYLNPWDNDHEVSTSSAENRAFQITATILVKDDDADTYVQLQLWTVKKVVAAARGKTNWLTGKKIRATVGNYAPVPAKVGNYLVAIFDVPLVFHVEESY